MLIKAFRLFVSSTFADFAAERDVLQARVFPALDAYCAAKGYQFYPIDLRWGVNEEAQLDQRTAEICLNEVRAAKEDYPPPNFLILIGSRYGFVPLPYAIAHDEFDAILGWLEGHDKRSAADSLRAVYQRDDNHLVPRGLDGDWPERDRPVAAFTLRSRVDELTDLRAADAWAKREAELRTTLQEAADGLLAQGGIGAAVHEKYFLSLTDQEIILGLPGYKGVADLRPIPNGDGPHAIAFIRDLVAPSGPPPASLRHYFEQTPRLEELRAGIRRALPADDVATARADVDENGRLSAGYLADFAARIEQKLQAAIDQYIARVETMERAPDHALESERAAHRAFAELKLEVFVGREDALAAIARYLAAASDRPLVLHGRSGLGKSAVMARAIANAEAGRVPVVARFVGASAASSNLRALLISIIEDLAVHGIVSKPAEFEQDANKFNAQIEKVLASITTPVIVFLDALDQSQRPRDLGWLPVKLPATFKLVISVLDDAAYEAESDLYRGLRDRLPTEAFLELGPLGKSQGRQALSALERQDRRRLRDGQRDYIIDKFEQAGGSPLYLKTAFEVARSWKSHYRTGVGNCLLAADASGLIAQFIGELSSVHHHEPELVTRTLAYLAAAKNGLSAKELTEILSRDGGVMRAISSEQFGARTDKLPPSLWIRLNRDLSSFLVEKQIDDQPLLQFFHRQVAEVARAQHYESSRVELHAALAAYFETQASEQDGKRVYAKRSLSELPYQLHHASNAARLGEILLSPEWMQQKLIAFGTRPLIDDYQYARTRSQTLTGQALELSAGALRLDPRQLAAQLIGRVMPQLVDDFAERAKIERLIHDTRAIVVPPALVPCWPRLTVAGGPQVRRFEGHDNPVMSVTFAPDGRNLVSGSADRTLRLWDAASGREIRRFEGHTSWVRTVACSPDGRHIVSGAEDRTVRLWETASGREIRRFAGHTSSVWAVAFSPDGRHIVSGSDDKTLRLWDAANGREIRGSAGHTDHVRAVAFSPDGRQIVSGSDDKTLRLWEAASGREIRRFEGSKLVTSVAFSPDGRHIVSGCWGYGLWLWEAASGREILRFGGDTIVTSVAFSPDGRHIASGSRDKTVRLWEVAGGREIARFEGHSMSVMAVAFSPDGRQIISGSEDRMLWLWEAASERESGRFEGHTWSVTSLAFSPDGRHIVSGSRDKTVRLWEAASGREIRRFEAHTVEVGAVAFSPDGRYIVSSSGHSLHLWEAASGREIRRFEGHTGFVYSVAFSPDGREIISGSYDKTLRLWEAASGREIRRFEGHTEGVNAVAFSPDGGHIASGSDDKTVRLWEVASGREIRRFEGHTVAFSPDGRHIVSRADHSLHLWDAASGREIRRFEGHAVAFSPDGRHIVSCAGHSLRLWEAASGRELARFEGESGFGCLAVAPDGKSLAAGDAGGRVHLFDVLVGDSDKATWLCGLGGSGPHKPAAPPHLVPAAMRDTPPSALASIAARPTSESATPRKIEQLKELVDKCNEEINSLSRILGPVERGWVDLPDDEVARLKQRISECESEAARLRQELAETLPPRRF